MIGYVVNNRADGIPSIKSNKTFCYKGTFDVFLLEEDAIEEAYSLTGFEGWEGHDLSVFKVLFNKRDISDKFSTQANKDGNRFICVTKIRVKEKIEEIYGDQ